MCVSQDGTRVFGCTEIFKVEGLRLDRRCIRCVCPCGCVDYRYTMYFLVVWR